MKFVRVGVMAAVMAASAARASEAVIGIDSCSDGNTASFTRALRDSLAQRPGTRVKSEEDTARSLGGIPKSSLADIQRVLAGARVDFYDQGNYGRAERTLKGALEELLLLPPSEERWKDQREIHTLLAWVYLKLQRKTDAERMFTELLKVEPDFRPDVNRYAPSLGTFADGLRTRIKAEPKRALTLLTQPVGLPIFVDGRPVGKSPQNLKLPAGEYRVEANFNGRRGLPKTVRLDHDATAELNAGFDGAIYPDKGPCIAPEGGREGQLVALVRTAALVGVTQIIAVRLEELVKGERYLVAASVDASSGQETREAKVKMAGGVPAPGAIVRLAEFMATGEAVAPVEPVRRTQIAKPTHTAPSVATVFHSNPEVPGNSLRTGSYIAGGAGALALAGAVFYLTQHTYFDGEIQKKCLERSCGSKGEESLDLLEGHRSAQIAPMVALAGASVALGTTAVIMHLLSADSPQVASHLFLGPTGAFVRFDF